MTSDTMPSSVCVPVLCGLMTRSVDSADFFAEIFRKKLEGISRDMNGGEGNRTC